MNPKVIMLISSLITFLIGAIIAILYFRSVIGFEVVVIYLTVMVFYGFGFRVWYYDAKRNYESSARD